jgi:hypothetical protein
MTKRKHVSPEALDASLLPKQRRPIPHAFVLDAISTLSPYTRPMFGCLAIYLKDKIVLILRDKPKSTADNGVWLATTQEHHQSLRREFPNMRSIQVLGKRVTGWQVLPVDALTLNQRHCGHASLCWLETLGSAKFRAHERRSPDQKRLEDRRSRSTPRRDTQLIAIDGKQPFSRYHLVIAVHRQEGTMNRERALKVVLVVVGLLFSAGVYPLIGSLLNPAGSDMGDTMMLSLYVALGIFLLIAVRNPSAHRSLIAFAAWSSFAHAVAMSILGLEIPSQRTGFLIGSAVLVVIGVTLIALAPAKQCNESHCFPPKVSANFPAAFSDFFSV